MPEFDFGSLAIGLAAISFGMIGVLMAGIALFGEWAEHAKRTWLPSVIVGLVLVGVSTTIIGFFAP
jgi:drug/metabolite transporter (DMT)-like permease